MGRGKTGEGGGMEETGREDEGKKREEGGKKRCVCMRSWVEKNMRAGMITLHELLCSVEGHVGRLDIVVYCWWRRQQ